ncbi:MAG: O-antigen ligase family protein, partial [Acidocella sp.]|nr:O-antigen ligase family protein [Acidocella sp.]
LSYLAWNCGKFKCRYVAIGAGCVALGAGLLWSRTPDSAPWYVKRADLGRSSAQHRAAAWRAGLEIMRDHPFGVGWNNAVSLYDKSYSPPEGGAAAITTNDYMMIGTELGIPDLLCFLVYVGLCLRSPRNGSVISLASNPGNAIVPGASVLVEQGRDQDTLPDTVKGPTQPCKSLPADPVGMMPWDEARHLRVVCRAGALVFVVAFWFDGGLFKLPTAALFWVLLELGAEHRTGQTRLPAKRVL